MLAEIAAAAVQILAPVVADSAKKLAGQVSDFALDRVEVLLNRLRARWADKPAAQDTLDRFEKNPERYAPMMEDVLKEEMEADPELAAEVDTFVKEVGPTLNIVQTMDEGEDVTGVRAGKIHGAAEVNVQQTIKQGRNITGADVDEIG